MSAHPWRYGPNRNMLTPTDIHLLVGQLTLVTNPDDVEILLGDLVYDVKANERRDVDVTITYKDSSGSISAFKGIEVKKHKRPLDVTHVEQLCIKLNDMPNISHKAIVSASGYTRPSCKKAKAHGVDLYSLIPWSNKMEGFEHVEFPPDFFVIERVLSWVSPPSINYQLERYDSTKTLKITKDTPVCNISEEEIGVKTIQQLSDRLSFNTIQQLINNENIKDVSPGVEKSVQLIINDLNNICIDLEGDKKRIKQALLKGMVVWKEYNHSPDYKLLVKDGELKPLVGCAIMEMRQGNLSGLTVSRVDRNISFINIPISDRNRKKIQGLKLT